MKKLELEEIKLVEFNILKKFHKICVDNDLKYMLCGGTLIGSIRHKGFIPWDDDIDVLMPRNDYDKFVKIFKENDLKLFNIDINKQYYQPYSKLVDKNTILIEHDCLKLDDYGIFIDIFPMDGIPKNQEKLYKKLSFYKYLLFSFYSTSSSSSKIKTIVKKMVRLFTKIIGGNRIAKKINSIARKTSYNESEYVGDVVAGYGIREVIKKSDLGNFILGDFEGEKFYIPEGYDIFLRNIYGNYMELPPVEQRVGRHSIEAYKKN